MKSPPIPVNEAERLRALYALRLLDTPAEARFDRLTRIARQLFGVQRVLISLVDKHRQWFKSMQGLEICETDRNISFCGHAIVEAGILQVVDARADPRFADNPLVTDFPHVRFYAGAPLRSAEGYPIGTLCLIDSCPRQLTDNELHALEDLAQCVENEINHQQVRELQHYAELSERRSQSILDAIPDMVFVMNRQAVFINTQNRTDLIVPAGNIVGRSINDIMPEDIARKTRLAIAEALHTSQQSRFETAYDFPQGTAWFEARVQPLDGDEVLVLIRNVTRERADAEQLKASERRLAGVLEGTRIGTWEWNVQTGATVFNARWAEMLGYRLEELGATRAQLWRELFHPEDRSHSEKLLTQHFNGQQDMYDCQHRLRHKQGHWVWVHARGRVIEWTEKGKPWMMYGTQADITAQKQAQLELLASETRLRGLFELSPIGIALNDFETGAFLDANAALLNATGYSRDEFLTLSHWRVTPEDYAPQERLHLETLTKTGRYGPYEKHLIRKDGSLCSVLINAMLVDDSAGRQLIWSMIEDTSQRKLHERMKSEFVSMVSHELRTPLTAISGALGLLLAGKIGEVAAPMQEILGIAQKNSQRLMFLINDLLDMDKLLSGKMPLVISRMALAPLLEQSIDNMRSYADQYQVHIHLQLPDQPVKAMVDPQRLEQIIANLLSNACKFSPAGGDVTVSVECDDDHVRLRVRDQGPGVSDDYQARLFEKFSQADGSDRRSKGGTGLGLAITKELVERMGGIIYYEKTYGAGACFCVSLPISY